MKSQNTQPLVSIVTPCWNGESHLDGYFSGLLSQTYEDIELIFVNDGSTDGTETLFLKLEESLRRRFHGRVKYISQANGGPCAAMNAGYSAASGDLIAPCDSDDIMLPNRIADHVACFNAHPGSAMVYGDYYICAAPDVVPSEGELKKWSAPPSGRDVYTALLRHGMFIKCGAYCFRRRCLSLLPGGKLDESDLGQNLALLLRVTFHEEVSFHAAPVVKIIQRKGSICRGDTMQSLAHTFKSRTIVERVVRELGCTPEIAHAIERRYLPRELLYHLVVGDLPEVRRCVWRSMRCRLFDRRFGLALICSYLPRTRASFLRRYFPELGGFTLT